MRVSTTLGALPLLVLCLIPGDVHAGVKGLMVPEGFEIEEFADASLANDIIRMTVDPKNRIVVSGRGYIRILSDDDGDGRADRAIPFAEEPKDGAMGMLWEGDSLLVVGDGGLRRLRDADGDDRADGPSELIRTIKTGGEHDAHALRRGPDGWLYLLCGNFAGIDGSWASLPTSPIKEPVAGCVLRFPPDLKGSEIVADGFRNPYGFDFGLDGRLFAYDSDNERCVSLPWYEPTRFYHVVPGGHHGWQAPQVTETWRLPPYLPDVVAPVVTLGRGSPTGVVCYRHSRFPELYRGGFFVLDWTFGRVIFLPLSRSGASYKSQPVDFITAVGDEGFAPSDLVVHPETGDLYIAIGGRGTRGAVFRVRYVGQGSEPARPSTAKFPFPIQSLEPQDAWLNEAVQADPATRLDAIVNLRRHRGHFGDSALSEVVLANWDRPEPELRQGSAELIKCIDVDLETWIPKAGSELARSTLAIGLAERDPAKAVDLATSILEAQAVNEPAKMAAVRAVQLALGGIGNARFKGKVWDGYSARDPSKLDSARRAKVLEVVRNASRQIRAGNLERELTRTLAMLEDDDPTTLADIADRLNEDSDPLDDIHHLIVVSRLKAPRSMEVSRRVARSLLGLDRKLDARHANRDRNWALRVGELHGELARKDPRMNELLVSDPNFGRRSHALFAWGEGFDRRRAAEVFLEKGRGDTDFAWDSDVVAILGELPAERAFPVLRGLWGRGGLEEAILPILARHPESEDRSRFVAGLNLPQIDIALRSLDALDRLPAEREDGDQIVALVRLLGRFPSGKESQESRRRVVRSLRRLTGADLDATDSSSWADWLARHRPRLAERLAGASGVDLSAWRARLSKVDWSKGDVGRGALVFQRASCAACHVGGRAVGPDLSGVTGRFSREDLFTAILQPSRDISARYQSVTVGTHDGRIYQGIVIYEAVDGVILQTGATTTVRISGADLAERRGSDVSLMPAGLLEPLSNQEIADLYAYLGSLGRGGSLPRGASSANLSPVSSRPLGRDAASLPSRTKP